MTNLANSSLAKSPVKNFLYSNDIEIKVLFTSSNPALLGRTFEPEKVYISKSKICIEVCRSIDINSTLDMSVNLKSTGLKYRLTGNVSACLPIEKPDHYHLSIVLRERNDAPSDFIAWNKNFKGNFNHLMAHQ